MTFTPTQQASWLEFEQQQMIGLLQYPAPNTPVFAYHLEGIILS
jgi:hypothetical protein